MDWSVTGVYRGRPYMAFGKGAEASPPTWLAETIALELAANGGVLALTPTGPFLTPDLTKSGDLMDALEVLSVVEVVEGSPPRTLRPSIVDDTLVH